jgi:hypothetical protein
VCLGGGGTHDPKTLAELRVHEAKLYSLLTARSELLRKRPNVSRRWVMALGRQFWRPSFPSLSLSLSLSPSLPLSPSPSPFLPLPVTR